MQEVRAHIEVVIDTTEPVELGDFVSAFTSIAAQYRRYMRQNHPDLIDDTRIYVREVRPGSIIAELILIGASLIGIMDQIQIVHNFVTVYGEKLRRYLTGSGEVPDANKTELNEFMGSVAAIANSEHGAGTIKAVAYEDGKRQVKASIEFNKQEASRAVTRIEAHAQRLDAARSIDNSRVLMTFKRSDIGDAGVGMRSGERVIIGAISDRDLPLIYGSALAEQRIKDQMRNTDENIYRKGFVVDVKVETRGGRPIAYAVLHVHQIIDIDE